MIKAILVDDHMLFRDGLTSSLNDYGQIKVIGQGSNFSQLKKVLNNEIPDILLLDISLEKESGLEILTWIKGEYPQIKVIMVSMFISEDFVITAIRNRADGYIPKDTSQAELLAAIIQINQGIKYFPENIKNIILDGVIKNSKSNDSQKDIYESLTQREKEILRLVAEGWSNNEIADKLCISIRTVETHKTNVMQKIGAKTVVDLVKFAIRKKIIQL